jgi:P4 family phage/plasmid primase-like protien
MKLKSKSSFYTAADFRIARGMPIEEAYNLAKEYDGFTKEEVDEYIKNRTASKQVSLTLMNSKEQKEIIYAQLDEKISKAHPYLIISSRGENNIFFEYSNGVYYELKELDMYNLVDEEMVKNNLLDHRTSTRKVTDTIRRLASILARTEGKYFKEEDVLKQDWKINLKNGLLNTKNWKLESHTPEYFSTVQVPFNYEPEAECPEFLEFIKTVSNQKEGIALMIKELFGYSLLDGNSKHKIHYLYGDTARNGKTTTALILLGLIGRQNASTLSLAQLAGDKSSPLTSLIGKQINFSDEISSKYIDSSRLTSMSAEGIIEIDPKFKSSFLYKIKAKFIVACNDLPQMTDSQGMKHRMIVIPFQYHIPPSQRIDRFEEKLLAKEGSGILNWAIESAKVMQTQKEFTFHEDSLEDMKDNNLQNNTVYAFIEENFILEEGREERFYATELYGDAPGTGDNHGSGFRAWCKKKGVGTPSIFKFQRELKKYAKETDGVEQKRLETGERYYTGIKKMNEDERIALSKFNDFK